MANPGQKQKQVSVVLLCFFPKSIGQKLRHGECLGFPPSRRNKIPNYKPCDAHRHLNGNGYKSILVSDGTPNHESPRREKTHKQGESIHRPGHCTSCRKEGLHIGSFIGKGESRNQDDQGENQYGNVIERLHERFWVMVKLNRFFYESQAR